MKWAFQFAGRQKWRFYYGLFLAMLVVGFIIAEPFFFRVIVDDVLMKGDYTRLVPLLSWSIAMALLFLITKYISIISWEIFSQEIVRGMRKSLFERIIGQSQDFFRQNATGDLITKCSGDVEIVRHFLCWVIPNALESLLTVVAAFIVFVNIDPLYALCLFTLTPFAAVLSFIFGRKMRPAHSLVSEQRAVLSTVVNEYLNGVRIIKAFTREAFEKERFSRENESYRDALLEANRTWLRYAPFIESLAQFLNVINLVVGGIMVITGRVTLGQMQIFTMLAWAVNQPMIQMGAYVNDAQRAFVSGERLVRLYYCPNSIKTPETPLVTQPDSVRGDISFKNVSLQYNGVSILSDIDLEIAAGKTVGFMGPTGSGKTTLVSLIPRFADVTKGAVLVDGVNVERYALPALRGAISMTMQDVFLFSASVEDNISYGQPESPFERVRSSAVSAAADGFVSSMPDGYQTIVGERGTGLSGGQKQRISLARALLPEPRILILDDTTSAVDMETEKIIQNHLKQLTYNATVIIIAQRVSSIRHADCIYILDGGRITESGTHDELMAQKGYYYHTFLLQQGLPEGGDSIG